MIETGATTGRHYLLVYIDSVADANLFAVFIYDLEDTTTVHYPTNQVVRVSEDVTTAQNDLDLLTGADGATLATSQPNYAPAKAGDAMALTAAERDSIAAALLDLAAAIDGKTPRETLRYMAAALAGKISGAGTGTETAVGLDAVTNRVRYTVDENGNRTAVAYDP